MQQNTIFFKTGHLLLEIKIAINNNFDSKIWGFPAAVYDHLGNEEINILSVFCRHGCCLALLSVRMAPHLPSSNGFFITVK